MARRGVPWRPALGIGPLNSRIIKTSERVVALSKFGVQTKRALASRISPRQVSIPLTLFIKNAANCVFKTHERTAKPRHHTVYIYIPLRNRE
jgi:hypothetical protein